jgi:FtsP/CotA-like multicopper oxidase with cupredoxin domain
MIVYAADGNYVEPQEVDILLIGVGARCELALNFIGPCPHLLTKLGWCS